MTTWQFVLSMAAVLVPLLALAWCSYDKWQTEEQSGPLSYMLASAETKPELCLDDQTREEIRSLMLDSLSEALKLHVAHVYEVWLKDDTGQPGRARTGVERGVRAYLIARRGALDWGPPACAG